MSTNDEPLFTLAEARQILNRAYCDRHGHQFERQVERTVAGDTLIDIYYCAHCGAEFIEKPKP